MNGRSARGAVTGRGAHAPEAIPWATSSALGRRAGSRASSAMHSSSRSAGMPAYIMLGGSGSMVRFWVNTSTASPTKGGRPVRAS